ncbi:MAG: MltR family transcriptional regulator [Deltaproteobacteria bacterium]|nr:MltR family transcriptional regulator [Deltaproteobacteria bacterium]
MKKKEISKDLFDSKTDDILKFNHEFRLESDRDCGSMAAAYLDEALKDMLASYMVNDKRLIKDLFNGQGALATFSSRINIAFALGKLSKEAKNDLHIIRKIRNEFAQVSDSIDFENEIIKKSCKELKHQALFTKSSSREMFTRAVLGVLAMIQSHETTAKRPKTPKDLNLQGITNFEEMIRGVEKIKTKEIKAEQAVPPDAGDPEPVD